MCYKVSTPKKHAAEAAYNFAQPYAEWNSSYHVANGFDHPLLPAIINYKEAYRFIDFELGFVKKDYTNLDYLPKYRAGTLNARGERIFKTDSYKEAILSKRCLIIIDGFYESHKLRLKKDISIPYFITLKEREIFALAGIWDTWKHPASGEIIRSCSIVTTFPNQLLTLIHNKIDDNGNPDPRMPVILSKEDELKWLDPSLKDEEITSLIKTFPDELMKAHPVSKLVNARKENPNVPEVKEMYDYAKEGFMLPV